MAELLEDGEVARHVWRTRRVLLARRAALVEAIRRSLGGALEVAPPPGGMALWCRTAPGIDVEAWSERARERGVAIQVGSQFAFDGRPRPFVRLGFGRHDERELGEAVERLARALTDVRSRRRAGKPPIPAGGR